MQSLTIPNFKQNFQNNIINLNSIQTSSRQDVSARRGQTTTDGETIVLAIQDSLSQDEIIIDVAEEDVIEDEQDVTEYMSARQVQSNDALGSQYEKMTIDNRNSGSRNFSDRMMDKDELLYMSSMNYPGEHD